MVFNFYDFFPYFEYFFYFLIFYLKKNRVNQTFPHWNRLFLEINPCIQVIFEYGVHFFRFISIFWIFFLFSLLLFFFFNLKFLSSLQFRPRDRRGSWRTDRQTGRRTDGRTHTHTVSIRDHLLKGCTCLQPLPLLQVTGDLELYYHTTILRTCVMRTIKTERCTQTHTLTHSQTNTHRGGSTHLEVKGLDLDNRDEDRKKIWMIWMIVDFWLSKQKVEHQHREY